MDPDRRAWEHSLRSGLYDKQERLTNKGSKNKNQTRTVQHRAGQRHLGITQSTPHLHTYKDREMESSLSHSPMMDDNSTDSSTDGSPRTNTFNKDYLSMIKKRQTILYKNSLHRNLATSDSQAETNLTGINPHPDIGGSSITRFSRHIARETRENQPLPEGFDSPEDRQRQIVSGWTPSQKFSTVSFGRHVSNTDMDYSHPVDLDGCRSTVLKVENIEDLPVPVTPNEIDMNMMKVRRGDHSRHPVNRVLMSESRMPRAHMEVNHHDGTLTPTKRMSYARSFTRKFQHSNDSWDNWEVGPTRKISVVQEDDTDNDYLDDLLTHHTGGKKKGKVKNIRAQMNCCSLMWHDLKVWVKRRKQNSENPIFRKQLKTIESQFGSGTVSFFLYVRWLLLLNMGLCLVWTVSVVLPQAVHYTGYNQMLTNFYFTNLIDGKNALSNSFMFYGGYEMTLGSYPLGLVYFFCVLITYFGSLFIIFKEIAGSLEAGGSIQDTRYTYFNLVICGWDYSIRDHDAVDNMSSGLLNTFKNPDWRRM